MGNGTCVKPRDDPGDPKPGNNPIRNMLNMMTTQNTVPTAAPTPAYTRCMSSNIRWARANSDASCSADRRLTIAAVSAIASS